MSQPIQLPAIAPSTRQFTTAIWPTSESVSQSGTVSRRLWGSTSNRAVLTLTFQNRPIARLAEFQTAHELAKGSHLPVVLSPVLLQGMPSNQLALINPLTWRFMTDTPPAIDESSDACGIGSTTIVLRGTRG